MKSVLNDLENNIAKIPVYVSFCLTKIKKKLYKFIVNPKDKEKAKKDKEKIKNALLRLFYKNILARLLKRLTAENEIYITQNLGFRNDEDSIATRQIFE